MTSLRQLLSVQAPLLVLDAASTRVQAGLFLTDGTVRWQTSDEEAGVGIFGCVEALGFDLDQVRGFAFCEGPGSVLGVRTSAMALRMWQVLAPRPAFAYCSLALVAHAQAKKDAAVIADARRDLWHHYTIDGGLQRMAAAELTGHLLMPEGFRHWSPLPAGVTATAYLLADLLPRTARHELFRETSAPDAFLQEEPDYATWTPHIHRAPATQ